MCQTVENVLTDISLIKGKTNPEADPQKKTAKKKREPVEKFTTQHLTRDSGIPEIIKRGRRLDPTDFRDIVFPLNFVNQRPPIRMS